jgi:hypothetical protein
MQNLRRRAPCGKLLMALRLAVSASPMRRQAMIADPRARYLHVHFAAPGCYAARVERA